MARTDPKTPIGVTVFADVWTRRDFVAAGVALAGIALVVLGRLLGSSGLMVAGVLVMIVGAVVLTAWRITSGRDRPHDHDEWV